MDLVVTVIEGENLSIPGGIYQIRNIRNTRALIEHAGESVCSEVIAETTCSPMWNVSKTIYDDNIIPGDVIAITVYRSREWLPNMYIGACQVEIPNPGVDIHEWYDIYWDKYRKSGKLNVKLEWIRHNDTNPEQDSDEIDTPPILKTLPSSIPRYHPDELHKISNLGSGSYALVTQCLLDGEQVAVKTFHVRENHSDAFIKEVNALYQCDSEYIIKLRGIATCQNGQHQIILEYMNNGHLRQFLDRRLKKLAQGKKHDIYDVLHIALQIAQGLDYLHQRRIIHRDIKPANILLDKNQCVKIGDLGTMRDDDLMQSCTNGAGSLKWMAPEVRNDTRYSTSADIYSFGVILTELDTLKEPFADVNPNAVFSKISRGEKPRTRANCVQWYKDLVTQCLQNDPNDRPSAQDIVYILNSRMINADN